MYGRLENTLSTTCVKMAHRMAIIPLEWVALEQIAVGTVR